MTVILRAVLDTNVLVSALIFKQGSTVLLRELWQSGRFQPLVSRTTVTELIRVLAYPKFRLTQSEQEELLADYLPYCEAVQMPSILPEVPACRDPLDLPFLHLALIGEADYLVTGDQDLLALKDSFERPIVKVEEFIANLN